MNQLKIEFENCFGIEKLYKEFKFTSEYNVNLIYAKNGLMKTSFTKVFKKFQDGKQADIKDLIFNNKPVKKNILVDGTDIVIEEIFVINSFEKAYESDSISSLLINDNLKTNLEEVLNIRNEILKNLEKKSGLKISKTSLGKMIFELESQMMKDFSFSDKSFLQNLNSFILPKENNYFENIKYCDIFDESVLNKKIKSTEFQTKITEYIKKSDEIYKNYAFFEKGSFTLPKLKGIEKELKGNNFFVKDNKILLNGDLNISTIGELNSKIKEIEKKLKDTKEFVAIEKLLSDAKGIALKDIIETYPEILEELKESNLEEFRKRLWLSYLKLDKDNFENLKEKYSILKTQISSMNIDDTPWKEAIDIFNTRFNLPFKMEVDNLTSSITGENLPKIIFSFIDKNGNPVKLNRDELENRDSLSQGEKRALYLLNIIFDIEKRKKDNQKTLFIIDDIADSFDYKNKYAIIEYLKDISEEKDIFGKPYFYMIILSHNFDFYRSISSRLNINWDKKLHALKINNEIKIVKEHYQNNPFEIWKDVMSAGKHYKIDFNSIDAKKHILALIPFVRNLIEYGIDRGVNTFANIDEDYLLLTHLLHLKNDTKHIKFEQLKMIYKEYIGKDNFDSSINIINDNVYDLIIEMADYHISDDDNKLENKIILAIAIRLKAEEFMIKEIKLSSHIFCWKNNNGNQMIFLDYISTKGNQTRELFSGFCQIGTKEVIKVLDSVNIMTPENIHINSFMYEPLLDMDISELKKLYNDVKSL